MNTVLNMFHFHTLRLVLRYFTVSLANPIPHSYCGCTSIKCPTINTRRDPMNHGIFLVLVFTQASLIHQLHQAFGAGGCLQVLLHQKAGYSRELHIRQTLLTSHPVKSPAREASPTINTMCHP